MVNPDSNRPWFSVYPENVPTHIDFPEIPLYSLLDQSTEKYPNNTALIFMGKKTSYQELSEQVNKFANALVKLGVKPKSRVAVMLPNCPQYVISYYAILKIGAIVVQTNPLYMENELIFQLNDAEAEFIITLDILSGRINKVINKTLLKSVIITSIKDALPFPINYLYPIKAKKDGLNLNVEPKPYIVWFKDLISSNSSDFKPANVDVKNDIAVLQYTGGTTGTSKGVMLTHYNLLVNTIQVKCFNPHLEDGKEVMLSAVPFFHVYGMTVCLNQGVLIGAANVLIPKFEIDQLLKAMKKNKPTIFPGAPTMYIAVINHPQVTSYDLTSIKVCISGSAPLPIEVQQEFERITKGNLVEGYGLSEASPVTHCTPLEGKRKPGIGLPLANTDCKIVDLDTNKVLGPGEIGELLIKGPQIMKGYWNRPEETREVLEDGWLRTGDIAMMDEEGCFSIVDRKKDMIIAGGFNIYPRDVEEVLFQHPSVQEAVVIGVPDKYRGETVKAYIVLKENASVSEKDIINFCRERMAKYKAPTIVEFRAELPKSMVGKVLRRVLAEEEKKSS
ncbi:MAG: long-chain fatty acid--CoA ligase [Bacillota bacterium]|nr:long-chain fatty acid--CoA ligase [Bacillota bacterium]